MNSFNTPHKQTHLPNFSPSPTPFNPVATENLLRELKHSINGIDKIIEKSKNIVGSNQSQFSQAMERNNSGFQLNISCSINFSGDQSDLNYSLTPHHRSKEMSPEMNRQKVEKWRSPERVDIKKKLSFKLTPEKQEKVFMQDEKEKQRNVTTYKKNYPKNFKLREEEEKNQYEIYEQKPVYKKEEKSKTVQKKQITCVRNELQNLLGLNRTIEREAREEEESLERQKKKTKAQTPKYSKSKSPINRRTSSPINYSRNEKPKYIDKFVNKMKTQETEKSPNKFNLPNKKYPSTSKSKSPKKTVKKEPLRKSIEKSPIYSHPGHSKYKRTASINSLEKCLKQKPISKEGFMKKMKGQCYVRRFLKDEELEQFYKELVLTRVDPYLWEQKVIQKIFKKIHDTDYII